MKRKCCFVILAVWFLGLLLSGCARLSVQIDILNSAYWASQQYVNSVSLAKIADAEQAILDGRFVLVREKFKKDVRQAFDNASKEPLPKGAVVKPIEPNVVDKYVGGYNRVTIDPYFAEARRSFQEAFDKASAAGQATREAKILYASGVEKLASLPPIIENDISKDLELPLDWSSPALKKMQKEAAADLGGLIGGAGLLDDPRAAAVVYAPQEYWEGPRFNETLCTGSFGNTDCAVKMEGLGDFTLKGVRLDATKITQATFSVAGQAIQIAAAVYGVPVPKSQPATTAPDEKGGESKVQAQLPPVEITSPIKRQRDAETAILQLRLARLAMFETIVAQRQAIEGTDEAKRKNAIIAIKAALEANRKQLDPDTAQ